MLLFEWDPQKAKKNLEIHGISFDEASAVFRDTLSLAIYDPLHSDEEDRFVLKREQYEENAKRSRHA